MNISRPEQIKNIVERTEWLYKWLDSRLDVLPEAMRMVQERRENARKWREHFKHDDNYCAIAENYLRNAFDDYIHLVAEGIIYVPGEEYSLLVFDRIFTDLV